MRDIGGSFRFLAFTFANVKVAKDFAPISQITPIVKSSTKPQENTIVRFITWTVDRCLQYHKKTDASAFLGSCFQLMETRAAGWCVWDLRNSKEIRV